MTARTIDIKVELTQHDDGTGAASVAVGPWPVLAELTPAGLDAMMTAVIIAVAETAVQARGAAALLALAAGEDGPGTAADPLLAKLLERAGRG